MINRHSFCFAALTVITTIALPAHVLAAGDGNLLENGSFETYAKDPATWSVGGAIDFNLGPGNSDIVGWTVVNGQIDYARKSAYTWGGADGNCSVDLGGSPGAGGVSQTFATAAGETYRVQFSMSGNPTTGWSGEDLPNKTLRVQAAGQTADFAFDVAAAQNTIEDMKWKLCTLFFVAESDLTTLDIFSTMEPVHIGPVIDNVSVVSASSWSPAGTYTGTNEPWEEKMLITVTPLDRDNQRFSIVSDVINTGNESRVTARGELVRTGPNTYNASQISYVTDESFVLTSKVVVSGTIVQMTADSLEAAWVASVYGGSQDPFAEGAVPLVSFPATAWYQRVPIVPPYMPPAGP